jgi:DNA-directed RNA polymerase II subunit RPB1
MGTVDRNQRCLTCNESMNDCPGHFGHIELVKPVFAIGKWRMIAIKKLKIFISSAGFMSRVKKILECVCLSCAKLKVDSVCRCQCLFPSKIIKTLLE